MKKQDVIKELIFLGLTKSDAINLLNELSKKNCEPCDCAHFYKESRENWFAKIAIPGAVMGTVYAYYYSSDKIKHKLFIDRYEIAL